MNVATLAAQFQRWRAHQMFPTAAIAAIGVALLAGAYAFEYLGGLKPCLLCLEQRVPWFVLIALSGAIGAAHRFNAPRLAIAGLYAVVLAVTLYSVDLSGYHAGIEYKLWDGPKECSGSTLSLPSDGDVLGGLSPGEIVRCNEIAWSLFGISMAGYNFLFSLVAVALALIGVRQNLREAR